jgi:putative transposase
VPLLHAHLVFVTKYRRPAFTEVMLTYREHIMGGVWAELDVEPVEFNGKADHAHLLVAYPPTLAVSVLVQRLTSNDSKAAPLTQCAANTPVGVSAPTSADTSDRRPTSPSPADAHRCRSSSNTSTDKPDHCERRAEPGDTRDGLTPD